MDPACGCGNFLVVAYRELRLLELDVLRELVNTRQILMDVSQVVFVDVDLNMATPAGKFAAHAMAAGNELVRGLIAERTKAALAIRKAQGVRLGRPSTLPAEVVARIVAAKAAGLSLRAIAAALTADGIATAQGGAKWHASTIKAVIEGQDAAKVNA